MQQVKSALAGIYEAIARRLPRLKLKTKLIISFIVIILAFSAVLTKQIITTTSKDIIQTSSKSLHMTVVQYNETISSAFSQIEEMSTNILANHTLYDFLKKYSKLSYTQLGTNAGVVNPVLGSYLNQDTIYSYQMFTNRFVYGVTNANTVSVEGIEHSGLVEKARLAKGSPVWVAGYDYGKAYGLDYLVGKENYQYRYLITMAREMHFSYIERGLYYNFSSSTEFPVLLININESWIRSLYESSIPYGSYQYVIFDDDGMIVSSNGTATPPASRAPASFLRYSGQSGYTTEETGGIWYLVCYDSMSLTDWTSVVMVPLSDVVATTTQHIVITIIVTTIVLVLIAISVSIFLSLGITRPIYSMIGAIQRFSQRDFSVRMPESGGSDFRQLAQAFNSMVSEIERLIEENYQSAVREKETYINMLSMQINPHFLYNTLNTISILSLQNGDEKASTLILCLSDMIHYAFKNTLDTASLGEEMKWAKSYVAIMETRYQGVFTCTMDIPERLYDCEIPKFSLQPFIENSIVHGFEDRESGGLIAVSAFVDDERLNVVLKDNGRGFDTSADLAKHSDSRYSGIGIHNVVERIELLYGKEYGIAIKSSPGSGTTVTISLPNKKCGGEN